jgi:peptidyl-prolyl cis-trans isomerase SurA
MKNLKVLPFGIALFAGCAALLGASPSVSAQAKPVLVEEVVARVDNEIITLSDYQKADAALHDEIAQQCQACPQDKILADYKDGQKNLLRDLIDTQLLIARAKDMNISVETDVIKRLDDVRKQNNLGSLEDLQKAVESSGMAWEDYKAQLRNSLMSQEVIRREVGSRMDIGSDEVKKYYDAHTEEFNRPEEVQLSESFLTTEKKTPEEIAAIQKQAGALRDRIIAGEDFATLAKRYSQGQTAQNGGDLGVFERGALAPQIEDAVFKLEKGQMTDPIQTKTGFEVIKVVDHFQAGLQPMDKVQNEIMNKLYTAKMEPALREYLAQLREENYVMVKPGYTDSAAIEGATVIQEVAPTPDTPDKKKAKKKIGLPKVSS